MDKSDGEERPRNEPLDANHGIVPQQQQQQQDVNDHADRDEWRRWLGKHVRETGSTIDANLTLFRVGCLLATVGSVAVAVRFSGAVRTALCQCL